MTDRDDADRLSLVGHLVEDSVRTDSQRVEAAKFSAKRLTGERLALEQAQRVLDRVDERPAQIEEVAAGPPGEDESRQRSVGGRASGGKLLAQLSQGDRLTPLDLAEPLLERRDRSRVGEDLGGLLQRLVLVDRHQCRSGHSVTGDEDVVTAIAYLVKEAAQIGA